MHRPPLGPINDLHSSRLGRLIFRQYQLGNSNNMQLGDEVFRSVGAPQGL